MSKPYAFISYSSKDADTAHLVQRYLEENGIGCWIASRNIEGGESFADKIVDAISDCSVFVLIASGNSNASDHVGSELSLAFGKKKKIIPFRLTDFDLSKSNTYFLQQAQWIDAFDDMGNALKRLLTAVRAVIPEESDSDPAKLAGADAPSSSYSNSVDSPIHINARVLPVLNYALQQNGTSVIQSIIIENTTNNVIENIDLKISSIPGFSLPLTKHIDSLPANTAISLTLPKLILNGEYLASMTERVTGVLNIEVRKSERILASEVVETTVLAFDEWHGSGIYPELLCSFVTPNHSEIAKIIARATEFLGKWTGDTSMVGYQYQDPNRVLSQAAAIFTAIKELAIAYAVPPASFEKAGQRVRLCDAILQQKLGTCLDLTLLYSACLEAVGLHPLLILASGHIFTGVWLEDMMFPECIQDDVSQITKRLASGVNEIAVVETTFVTTGTDHSFDEARDMGERNLSTRQIEYIIDVNRARMSGVYPLPQRTLTPSGWEIKHDTTFNRGNMTAPTGLGETIYVDPNAKDDNIPKKMQWERKLLDLGMRNTLINLRLTKTQLPILSGSLDELENALSSGSDFTILPRPADWNVTDFTFEALNHLNAEGIIQAEFDNNRLRSVLTEGELNKTIKELYRTSKTSLEENGANTLYLALGMLKWFENKHSTKARYAPIILVPIEMVRKSAAQRYVIRLRDDEPQMNITLLEKLKQDFGITVNGVDPLPGDEHGIDIRRVFTILRQAVMEQPHWDVIEVASIGIFSFSQFVMWNDIRNRTDDLMKNKIVRSLIEGKLCWDAKPLEIGERVSESNVLLPMPADASQLYAIQAACEGESFVLHGPPGTGKSQTITSLIANALANGKRVLFVAEKMAALEVVQKRLDSIGIGPFCLEVHSNKSKKKDVLEQLRKASEVAKNLAAEDYASKAEQLASMRAELDSYVEQLHKLLNCGSDLYSLINEYEYYKDAPDIAPFDPEYVQGLTKQMIEQQMLVIERLIAAAKEVGHPHGHPLHLVACTQYTQSLRSQLQPTVDAYVERLESMMEHVAHLVSVLGEQSPADHEQMGRLHRIAENIACWYDMPDEWTTVMSPNLYFDEVGKLAQHSKKAKTLKKQILKNFDSDFLEESGAELYSDYTEASSKWFLPKFFGINRLTKLLNFYSKSKISKEDIRSHIVSLRDYQKETKSAKELFKKYGQDLGALYAGEATDWDKVAKLATDALNSFTAMNEMFGNYDIISKHCQKAELKETVFGICEEFTAFNEAKSAFDSLLNIIQVSCEDWLSGQLSLCHTVTSHASELKEWIAYVGTANEAKSLGLANIIDSYESGAEHDSVFGSYKKALLQGLISCAIDESESLNQFSGAVFNKKIEQYKRMDKEWIALSQQEIFCRLASRVPDFTKEAAHSSELGILQRCIKSGGRGTSIRKLFDQIPNLLSRLCPCMLMSPISVAQYLDPKREPFDIVVFDEASQLPTCKAVGVIARGKDAVIVGDPKQMPPTSFFATNTVDEDNLENEDLESILDDCLALNMPQSHLLWHYRSRHESLISFSNSQFYENKLFTFPSVNDRESKVRLVKVEGVFDRGKSRTNKAEAEAVVEEIKRRHQDAELNKQSLGIVTFNISQQHLIDDLLNDACAKDPELEKWVYGSEEPVFIKNLENVQGDERDVILFSIGFGPDESGKMYMNFGPLNRDGGWRRLNVAVSRARCEMVVFTTMRSDQLDLNRTKAEGVAALRSFLEYAEGRATAISEAELNSVSGCCDGIVDSICKALTEEGYQTDTHVGRSEYRIDVGVIDPKNPDQYLLGIMLDGTGYTGAKTTRDREIAQIGVLNGLGWQIMRIWCMDWWDNRDKELDRILRKIKDIESGVKEPDPEPDPKPEPPTNKCDKTEKISTNIEPAVPKTAPIYTAASIPVLYMSAETFTEPWNVSDIRSRIETVIKVEAPISMTLLTKRVVQSFGISRSGSRIQDHITAMLKKMKVKTTQRNDVTFCWRSVQIPEEYIGFRVSGSDDAHRDVRDVPVQEVANAIYVVLYEQISMKQEDLLREVANTLGYTRLGNNVLSALTDGIAYAEEQGGIALGANGTYILSELGTAKAKACLESF